MREAANAIQQLAPLEMFVTNFREFLLIMARFTALFAVSPFFSSSLIPARMKGLLAFFAAAVVFPIVAPYLPAVPDTMIGWGVRLGNEVLVGLIIGFLVTVIFTTFQMAGQFYAFQMGLGISQVYDPLSEVEIPLVGQYKSLIGTLVFLAMDGHHQLIYALAKSYRDMPVLDVFGTAPALADKMIEVFSLMFAVALKIGLPVIATLLLVSVGMGLLAKTAPQMNIMMLGFQIKIVTGLAVVAITMPVIVAVMRRVLQMAMGIVNEFITSGGAA